MQKCFPVHCDFGGRSGVVGLRYAIAEVWLLKVIWFAVLRKLCEMLTMTVRAWVFATQKCRAQFDPNSRVTVAKHCLMRKHCLDISLLKRFCDWRSAKV